MKFENFISGQYIKQEQYKAFSPSFINIPWEWEDVQINKLLEEASRELGELNAFATLLPDVDIYIKMHIYTEANKSSKIEGTKTSIEEDLLPLEEIDPEKRNDREEVQNYIHALNYGIERIQKDDFPVSSRLICEIHSKLMQGVRGKHKTSGEFRKSQNWIGGTMPSNALYVPPHVSELNTLLSDFEKFIHNDNLNVPHLIKVALLHYQFESIHPFLDGNGRIGRLLIPLYLLDKKILEKPCFYISDYLERNRDAYYEALDRVRLKNDIIHWIKFFLIATIETAQSAKNKFKKVVEVVDEYKREMATFSGKYVNHLAILESFLRNPFQYSTSIKNELPKEMKISQVTINKSIKLLLKSEILREATGQNRNRIFYPHRYFLIFIGAD